MNFTFHNFNFKAILMVKSKASHLALLFMQGKSNLTEYRIGIPWGVTNMTLAPPPSSHLDPSKYIIISHSSSNSVGMSILSS